MMNLLPETILDKIYGYKHDLEYANNMNHIKMFKQDYDIPRYKKQVYSDRFPQIEMSIPIKKCECHYKGI